jgi:hypothetical protein
VGSTSDIVGGKRYYRLPGCRHRPGFSCREVGCLEKPMFDVIAWICIGLGALLGVSSVRELATAKPGVVKDDPAERRSVWSRLGSGVLIIAVGVSYLATGAKNDVLAWTAKAVSIAVISIMIALWFRARIRGKLAGSDH